MCLFWPLSLVLEIFLGCLMFLGWQRLNDTLRSWFEVSRARGYLCDGVGRPGYIVSLRDSPAAFSLDLISFPKKSLPWFFWLPAFGVPSSGENGWRFHSALYKKKSHLPVFVFVVLNSNYNISSIIQMRKLLKSLKFLYWVSWQLPFILWSETEIISIDLYSAIIMITFIERSRHLICYCHGLLGLFFPPKLGFNYAWFSDRFEVWKTKTVAYKWNNKPSFLFCCLLSKQKKFSSFWNEQILP